MLVRKRIHTFGYSWPKTTFEPFFARYMSAFTGVYQTAGSLPSHPIIVVAQNVSISPCLTRRCTGRTASPMEFQNVVEESVNVKTAAQDLGHCRGPSTPMRPGLVQTVSHRSGGRVSAGVALPRRLVQAALMLRLCGTRDVSWHATQNCPLP